MNSFERSAGLADRGGERSERNARGTSEMRMRILDVAREVFLRDTFENAKLDEIAALAQVGKGTLYRYFENKASLYVSALVHSDRFASLMRDCLTPDASAVQQLREIGHFYAHYWDEHPDHLRVFQALRDPSVTRLLSRRELDVLSAHWETALRVLCDVIQRGVERGELRQCDPWRMANVIWRIGSTMLDASLDPVQMRLTQDESSLYRESLELIVRGLELRASA